MASWAFSIRGQAPRWATMVLGVLPIVLLLSIWWAITHGEPEFRQISPTILPSPGEVFGYLPELMSRSDSETGSNMLLHHILASGQRVVLGFLLALVVVLPIGIGMGAFASIRATFSPLATMSGYIPIATLVPLTMSWFGTDEKQKIIFLAMAFAIYLLPLIVKAIDSVPDVFLRTAQTLGATRPQIIFRVLVPIAAPDLWHAMRLAFGVGWTYIVLTEALVQTDGLGFMIEVARRRGPREQIYLVIMIITVIAWLADLIWVRIGHRLFPYRQVR